MTQTEVKPRSPADQQATEKALQRAVNDLLNKRHPNPDDIALIPYGSEAYHVLSALTEAENAKKEFLVLKKQYSWLDKLITMPLPSTPGSASNAEQNPRRIRFLNDSQFENRPLRHWLIPGILPKSCIAMIFGPPACGKSFLAMAWCLCIATGIEWLGRSITKGPVAYIAAEGAFGLGPRIKAWKIHHNVSGDSGVQWFDETILLQDSSNLKELITALEEDFIEPPILVVIDTLSRCSGGADENSNTEMAKIIASADTIQQKFGCTVLIVHHAGKDKEKGPRGASALIGNMETIIEVAATDEGCKVVCYKQKDAPKFESLNLKLTPVQYGILEDEASAVLILGNEQSPIAMTKSESTMYAALLGKELTHSEWVKAGQEAKLSESGAKGAIRALVKAGRVQKDESRKVYFHTAGNEGENE